MTVLDNVKVAFDCRQATTLATAVLRTPAHRARGGSGSTRESRELLKIFKLDDLADERAKNLPYGSQRRLEIARAMATAPRLLLLDEPAAGHEPARVDRADGPDPLGPRPASAWRSCSSSTT